MENDFNFILFPTDNTPPKLLFRCQVSPNNKFKEISYVVSDQNPLKPSIYHVIEDEKVLSQRSFK